MLSGCKNKKSLAKVYLHISQVLGLQLTFLQSFWVFKEDNIFLQNEISV
jgi:hypothetical protein